MLSIVIFVEVTDKLAQFLVWPSISYSFGRLIIILKLILDLEQLKMF